MTKPNLQPSAQNLGPEFNEANCKKLGIDALHIMYPNETDEIAVEIARSICLGNCPAFDACRERGKFEPEGMWAAQMPRERQNQRRSAQRERRKYERNKSQR